MYARRQEAFRHKTPLGNIYIMFKANININIFFHILNKEALNILLNIHTTKSENQINRD